MHFVTVATPDELLSNNSHASNGMLWLAETQTVVARQFPTITCNMIRDGTISRYVKVKMLVVLK